YKDACAGVSIQGVEPSNPQLATRNTQPLIGVTSHNWKTIENEDENEDVYDKAGGQDASSQQPEPDT
ncbi:MAG: hypothetical protein PVJ35_14420, partial [Desulfobacterales bacterium]